MLAWKKGVLKLVAEQEATDEGHISGADIEGIHESKLAERFSALRPMQRGAAATATIPAQLDVLRFSSVPPRGDRRASVEPETTTGSKVKPTLP
ncbi:hypothetical protein CVT26_007763 [Gymnopilus dilepis]|uniref:Uncharacterized protein n=1 Tax=Gymnopilus dilepis TaxID=231916 RepID=A0A409WIQ7_9AGAR|nr:hypothetical protein CVT26_007763 [Gymnopilus dilepis]